MKNSTKEKAIKEMAGLPNAFTAETVEEINKINRSAVSYLVNRLTRLGLIKYAGATSRGKYVYVKTSAGMDAEEQKRAVFSLDREWADKASRLLDALPARFNVNQAVEQWKVKRSAAYSMLEILSRKGFIKNESKGTRAGSAVYVKTAIGNGLRPDDGFPGIKTGDVPPKELAKYLLGLGPDDLISGRILMAVHECGLSNARKMLRDGLSLGIYEFTGNLIDGSAEYRIAEKYKHHATSKMLCDESDQRDPDKTVTAPEQESPASHPRMKAEKHSLLKDILEEFMGIPNEKKLEFITLMLGLKQDDQERFKSNYERAYPKAGKFQNVEPGDSLFHPLVGTVTISRVTDEWLCFRCHEVQWKADKDGYIDGDKRKSPVLFADMCDYTSYMKQSGRA
jgi:predicted transcriptional regulator